MQSFLWFWGILVLSLFYGMRITRAVGYVQTPLLHWRVAVVLGLGLVVGAILVTHFGLSIHHDTGVALHAVLLFVSAWLGIRYWVAWRLWDVPAAFAALALVALYFADSATYNNVMLGCMALGFSVGGYYATKRWLIVFTFLMACFDGYAVWGSDTMDRLIQQQPGPFPSTLLGATLLPAALQIGVMDAVLGGLVTVGILRHRGIRRAIGFLVAYVGTVFMIGACAEPLAMIGITWFAQVPLLVVLAPLTWLFLRRHRTASAV